ncbi:hypothetical protein [Acinetobacter bereziniae]|uniref:hypothetical protein n=1 Tax=Acinetobacter bereziniae TaxID=106648 RepID=UPI00301A27EF
MNSNLRLAVQFVLDAFTVQDIVGDSLDWRYIKFNSQRFKLPYGAQDKIDEGIQYCIEQGYLTQDFRLTEKGFLKIRE